MVSNGVHHLKSPMSCMLMHPKHFSIISPCLWGTVFLSFITVTHPAVGGEYTDVYGSVVAQTVQDASLSNQDVSEAVKLAARDAKLEVGRECYVSNIGKQRLYFTSDGIAPFRYKHHSLVNGSDYLQRMHLNRSSDKEMIYHFTVSRDRDKDYHVFRKTFSEPPSGDQSSSHYHLLSKGMDTCINTLSQTPAAAAAHLFFPGKLPGGGNFSALSVRVASYNIWNVNALEDKGEDYETRLERLSKLIVSLNVDVIGFQEVRLEVGASARKQRKRSKNVQTQFQVSDLSRRLPDHQFVYQPAMLYMEKLLERKEEGLAIFSRYPILSADYRLLYRNVSDVEDTHQRICLHAELLIPHLRPVHVFVSHLSLSQSAQERSVVEIWEYMQSFSGVKILMGDMNAEPQSKTIRFLTGEESIGGVWTSNLHDTWRVPAANINMPGFTFSALEDKLAKRIDYILLSLPYLSGVEVATSEVISGEDICFLPCSDHQVVLTVLATKHLPISVL